jgi:hypothetical protein
MLPINSIKFIPKTSFISLLYPITKNAFVDCYPEHEHIVKNEKLEFKNHKCIVERDNEYVFTTNIVRTNYSLGITYNIQSLLNYELFSLQFNNFTTTYNKKLELNNRIDLNKFFCDNIKNFYKHIKKDL